MRTTVVIGLILVIAGALAMVLQLAGVFGESASLAIGNLEVEASREPDLTWLPWAAGVAVLAGVVMIVSGRRG
jgi:hypothetical protein